MAVEGALDRSPSEKKQGRKDKGDGADGGGGKIKSEFSDGADGGGGEIKSEFSLGRLHSSASAAKSQVQKSPWGRRNVIPLSDRVLMLIRAFLRKRLEENIEGSKAVASETYEEFWLRIDADGDGWMTDDEFSKILREELAVRNGEVSDVQIAALAQEFDVDDCGKVDFRLFKSFLWRDSDRTEEQKRHKYRPSHMMKPLLLDPDPDQIQTRTNVLQNPNNVGGSKFILREQRRLVQQAAMTGIAFSQLLELQQRMRKHLLTFCNRDNRFRKWRRHNGFRMLLGELSVKDAQHFQDGHHLGYLHLKSLTRRLREGTGLSRDEFSDKDLMNVYQSLENCDEQKQGIVDMSKFLEFVQMPLMSLKRLQASLKSFAVAKGGLSYPELLQDFRTLMPGYVTMEDFLGILRSVLKITLKIFPDCEARLFYEAFNYTHAGAVTLADLVEFISDGEFVFETKPERLPTKKEVEKKFENSTGIDLHRFSDASSDVVKMSDMENVNHDVKSDKHTVGDLLKAISSHQRKERGATEFMKDLKWEQECRRDELYAEAYEKGTRYSAFIFKPDKQHQEEQARALFANPPWQKYRKRSNSAGAVDVASPAAESASSGRTAKSARRSLTPPPSFPGQRQGTSLTKPWEKVASPVVTKDPLRTRKSSRCLASTTSRQMGEVGRRDTPAEALHPAGYRSVPAWTSSPRDPAARHHVSINAWEKSVPYAGTASLMGFGGNGEPPPGPCYDTADYELTKRAVLGYSGHQPGHKTVIERGYSQRQQAMSKTSNVFSPRDKKEWSRWDFEHLQDAYGRPPTRGHEHIKKTEFKGPMPFWFNVNKQVRGVF